MNHDREFNPIIGTVMAMGMGYKCSAGDGLHNLILVDTHNRWRYIVAKAGFRMESDTHGRAVFKVHFHTWTPAPRSQMTDACEWNAIDSDQVVHLIVNRQEALEAAYERHG